MDIPAAIFKAECFKLIDQVEKTREPIIITKHGRPVAQLAPVPSGSRSLFGYMRDTTRIEGDIVSPVEAEWSALSGDEDHFYGRTPDKRTRRKIMSRLLLDTPADRFLIAAARIKGVILATRDENIIDYGKAGYVRVLKL